MFYLFYQQINLRIIMKNNICTYDLIAFRDFQIDLYKTVVSGTYDGLALNGKHGLHLRHCNWLITNKHELLHRNFVILNVEW